MRAALGVLLVAAAITPAAAQNSWAEATGRGARPAPEDGLPGGAPGPALAGVTPQDMLVMLDALDIDARLADMTGAGGALAHRLGLTAGADGYVWDVVFYRCAADDAPVLLTPEAAPATATESVAAIATRIGARLPPPPPPDAIAAPLEGAPATKDDGEGRPGDGAEAEIAPTPAQIQSAPRSPRLPGVTACRDFTLSAAFRLELPVSVQTINRFNREHRFARASLSDAGDPTLHMDLSVEGGVEPEALRVQIAAWRALLRAFAGHIGY